MWTLLFEKLGVEDGEVKSSCKLVWDPEAFNRSLWVAYSESWFSKFGNLVVSQGWVQFPHLKMG